MSGKACAAFVANLLKRHPDLGDGLDDMEMSVAQAEVMSRWLRRQLPDRTHVYMGISLGQAYSYQQRGVADTEILEFDVEQPYNEFGNIFLEPIVWRAETLYPGLGSHLLKVLEKVNYRVVDILTPELLGQLASHEMWFGERTDKGFLREYRAMNGLTVAQMREIDVQCPSDYDKSLGAMYGKVWRGKEFSKSAHSDAMKKLAVHPWASQLLAHLNRLTETYPAEAMPMHELGCDEDGPKIRCDPSYALWWNEENSVAFGIWDEVVNYRFQASDTYSGVLLTADIADVGCHDSVIQTIEVSLPFIRAVDDFIYFLAEGNQDGQNKRSRSRKGHAAAS